VHDRKKKPGGGLQKNGASEEMNSTPGVGQVCPESRGGELKMSMSGRFAGHQGAAQS